MSSGLHGAARTVLQTLLWSIVLLIVAVVVMTVRMEYEASRDGGGEVVHSIGLMLAMLVVGYYALALLIGRAMLMKGEPSWGWHFVAIMLLLVFVPLIMLWRLMS